MGYVAAFVGGGVVIGVGVYAWIMYEIGKGFRDGM